MKDLAGLLNKLSLSTLTIQLIRPLSGSSYIKLPTELRSPKKGLINMILTDLCFTQQKKKKITFGNVLYSVLVVEKY